ncbi:MAG TPA: nickel-dependent hydrogenase large subunit [Rhodocyclaceae bacterium]|nr:nickel-dependent hydrogenase large subunit [Rhodocyclaceae bacterium]
MAEERSLGLRVPVLARVEGEGALDLAIEDGRLTELRLRIFEPPRLFEKFLEGREAAEIPDLVARVCGICPIAYQMSAVQALESVAGVDPGPWVAAMRRLVYCGEWIESHCLHIHLLAAPDCLGYPDAIALARDHPDEVRRGLRLQALGNRIIRLFGGRSVHPVGVRLGGFHRAPDPADMARLADDLDTALADGAALVAWAAALPRPAASQEFVSVALRHPQEYPLYSGRIVSSSGLDMEAAAWGNRIEERQVPHSTALHATLDGRPYLVGPLARINLNVDRLPDEVTAGLATAGIAFPSSNPFDALAARAAEVHFALREARRLAAAYWTPERPWADVPVTVGTGYGVTEAPRGILWHRYATDGDGLVRAVRLVPPTSQNQARIEEDLRLSLEAFGLDRGDDELRRLGERVIRNYDPCISCATHFLRLKVARR